MNVLLREVTDDDVAVFYEHQADPVAVELARVTARDPADHAAHLARVRVDPEVVIRTVVVDGAVAGQVLSFERDGLRQLGYRLGREFWGRGIAGTAVARFLPLVPERPLYAVVAPGNVASLKLLDRLGFEQVEQRPDALLVLRLDR